VGGTSSWTAAAASLIRLSLSRFDVDVDRSGSDTVGTVLLVGTRWGDVTGWSSVDVVEAADACCRAWARLAVRENGIDVVNVDGVMGGGRVAAADVVVVVVVVFVFVLAFVEVIVGVVATASPWAGTGGGGGGGRTGGADLDRDDAVVTCWRVRDEGNSNLRFTAGVDGGGSGGAPPTTVVVDVKGGMGAPAVTSNRVCSGGTAVVAGDGDLGTVGYKSEK
jgi:hypothetical protein